jgi:hypothetical protein
MTYLRVLPRDLFNEASLLKCLGRVWILLDDRRDHSAELAHGCEAFDVEQDEADGSISVANIAFYVRGVPYRLSRPLNSREAWPLYASCDDDPDFDEISVFDDAGNFSAAMLALISD